MKDQFQRDLVQSARAFIRGMEELKVPISISTPIGTNGNVLEEGHALLKNVTEENLSVSVNGSEVCITIEKVRVRIPELSFLLWEDWGPNIQTAGFVEAQVKHSDLKIQLYFETKDSTVSSLLLGLLFLKSHAELKHWDAKVSPISPHEKVYFQHSSLNNNGKMKTTIEMAAANSLARLVLDRAPTKETKSTKATAPVSSILVDPLKLHA